MRNEIVNTLESVWTALIMSCPEIKLFRNEVYFAGGCIRSLVQNEEPKDFDIFFKSVNSKQNFLNMCQSRELGIATMNTVRFSISDLEIQFVVLDSRLPLDEIMSFDFTFNMNYYDPETGHLFIYDEEAIKSKQIIFNYDCRNVFDTFYRVFNFLNRGYITPNQESLDRLAVKMTQHKSVENKQDFLDSTRRCSSAIIKYGRLDFLPNKE